MPAPTPYNRQFNFTNYQAVNPATPLPATPLDSELSSVKVTLDALITNLNLIQRSDGQLANASVGPQQLQPSILAGMSPPTQWSGAGVSYAVGNTVFSGLLFYVCNTANISSAGNPPATFAAWTLLADFSGVSIPAGSVTSAAFAPGAVNSAALGANLALPGSPSTGDNSTAIATTAFVDAQAASMLTGFKNRVINGAMAIDQRNSGASGTAVGYTADRWKYSATQASKASWQRGSSGPARFPFSLTVTSTSTYSPVTADTFDITTTIEAFDTYDFQWGTANAQIVQLSFWVNSSASGTFAGAIRNGAATRSYPFTFAVTTPSTWQLITVSIPGDTGGTWVNNTNAAGLIVSFGLAAGATFQGTAATWQTGNFTSVAGATQIVGVSAATFSVTGVSLQVGPGAAVAPFEFRAQQVELALCQRYFAAGKIVLEGSITASGGIATTYCLPVPMRANPTLTVAGTAGSSNIASPVFTALNTRDVHANGSGIATGIFIMAFSFIANADF